MTQFKDEKDTTHEIEINAPAIKRVREKLDLDLLRVISDGDVLLRLVDDPILLCDVVFVVCQPDMSEEDFGSRMAGDSIERATQALFEAIADFFPPEKRAILNKTIAQLSKMQAQGFALALESLDKLDVEQIVVDRFSDEANESTG